ncbi:DUF1493 family protein [Paraburkholderia sp.]|uniref:DUF1493 family protein n=1 Tax=Paraburkholderia sp. TaxID=1926495 RepID=UPI0039E722FD
MMQPQEVSADLAAFIREEAGISEKRAIRSSSVIEEDFGITGDDADNFMDAFSRRFNVQPGDFDLNRYFEMEGFGGLLFFITNWLRKRWGIKKYEKRQPLTVAMLQHAIDLGVWDSQRLMEWDGQRDGE